MFRYEARVPGSGDLQVVTAKGWSDGFSRFPGYRTKQWGKKMRGKNMAFVTGEGSDSFVTHSFDSDSSLGSQFPLFGICFLLPCLPAPRALSRSPALPYRLTRRLLSSRHWQMRS